MLISVAIGWIVAALRRTVAERNFLKQIINTIGEGIVVMNTKHDIIISNPAANLIFGKKYRGEPIEQRGAAYGLFAVDKVTPLPLEQLPFRRGLAGDPITMSEFFIRNEKVPDGKFCGSTVVPIRNTAQKVIAAVAVFRDITPNKLHEENLEQRVQQRTREVQAAYEAVVVAKQRVDTVLSNTDAILFSMNKDGIITFSEGKGLSVLGITPGERVGKSVHELNKDKPEALKLAIRALRGEKINARIKINGLWHEIHYDPIFDEQQQLNGTSGVAFNVHDQVVSEHALTESQQRLKTVLKHVPFSFWALDLERRFVFREGIGMKAIGLNSETMVGQSIYDIYKNHPHVVEAMERAYLGETFEVQTQIGDRWYNVAFAPSLDDLGKVNGISGITMDITDRKHAEDEKTNLEIRERTALEASRMKSEFLANMSHEIRTPINGVVGMAGLILETNLTPDQKDYAESIRLSGDTLLTLINDILDFSKVEARKLEIELLEFNLFHLINDAKKSLLHTAQQKNLPLLMNQLPDINYLVKGDPSRIRQVLSNLLSNAIKFTPKGNVELRAEIRDLSETDCEVRVEVRDSGIGIPEEALCRMFVAFSQADASTTRKFGGTGLGLSISKRLIELMGGEIGVKSKVDVGSTFWFTLPLKKGQPIATLPAQSTDKKAAPQALKFARVLIAEDNAINQKIAIRQLESLGIHADGVGNGNEALDALRAIPYDLVLMDCQMPELDGYETTRIIRSSVTMEFKDIPIIAMTANALSGDRQKCLDSGMNDYVSKPIKVDDLGLVISKWLRPKKSFL